MDRSPGQVDMEVIEDGDNVASNVEVLSEQPVEQMEASENSVHNSGSFRPHHSPHRRNKGLHSDTTRPGKKSRSRGLQFHLTTPEKMNLDYKNNVTGISLNKTSHKGELQIDKGVRARVSPTSEHRNASTELANKRTNDARQAFHARIFPQFVVPRLTTSPSDQFDDVESDRATSKGKSKRMHSSMNAALHKVARKEQQFDVAMNGMYLVYMFSMLIVSYMYVLYVVHTHKQTIHSAHNTHLHAYTQHNLHVNADLRAPTYTDTQHVHIAYTYAQHT